MEAPEKIYINNYNGNDTWGNQWHTKPSTNPSTVSHEYIRQDIHDETVETAEDHAYFAGQEKMREELLEWAEGQYERLMNGFRREVFGLAERYMADAYKEVIEKIKSL